MIGEYQLQVCQRSRYTTHIKDDIRKFEMGTISNTPQVDPEGSPSVGTSSCSLVQLCAPSHATRYRALTVSRSLAQSRSVRWVRHCFHEGGTNYHYLSHAGRPQIRGRLHQPRHECARSRPTSISPHGSHALDISSLEGSVPLPPG